MNLRTRIVLSLVGSAVLLAAPAVYGARALRELQGIAQTIRTRDAAGSLALGRLQAALGEAENAQRVQLALRDEDARSRADAAVVRVNLRLRDLAAAGYARETEPAVQQWSTLRAALTVQQRYILAAELNRADSVQAQVVAPGFAAMDRLLEPIAQAIDRGGEESGRRAELVATRASTTALAALAFGLAAAVLLGVFLTRSLLGPIQELRGGMARVAGGDFDPSLQMPPDRRDEFGDLARSFGTMTTRLAELDRLKAEFMSVASHEIKTPLNVIKGYASLLHDGIYGSVSDEQQKALASVIGQTDHLTRLVKRLLDISRLEAGSGGMDFRAIEFPHWVSELAAGFEVLAHQSNANFALEMDGPLPETIVGDPDRLAEVVGNLMSNAFKFTPPEGPIRLRVAAQPGEILLEVVDSGVGIPADKLPRIFEKFFQVDNEAQPRSAGSGLGLAIAREIVEGHGGTISASSEPGRGTTFRVVLPEQPPGAPAALQLSTNQTTT
ncbi:hypothetical protein BH24GEM2_BH24GEM2_06500 [soil metagenome]